LESLLNQSVKILFTNGDTSGLIVAFSANANHPGARMIASLCRTLKKTADDGSLHAAPRPLPRISAHLTKANPSKGGDAKQPTHDKLVDSGAAGTLRAFHAFLAPCTRYRAKCAKEKQQDSESGHC
jgi:hypothetical protein